MDRLREYVVDPCEDLLQVKGNFLFKAYDWLEIVNLLDAEETAYRLWKGEQAQLEILLNSKPERPVWLYLEPSAQPVYRPIRKALIIAMKRTFVCTDVEQRLWQIRQYVKRSFHTPLPGGPLELQKRGNYDELQDLCRKDLNSLRTLLPEDQKVDRHRYAESISDYMTKYFFLIDEDDGKPIWGDELIARRHRESLGFPEEKVDKCRNSPAYRPGSPPFSKDMKRRREALKIGSLYP